ncbi:hypothetical protein [Nocardioides bruguierae]|uniref:Uncharacterized protein n=1 Tax=Nocardioides bruguierae TaxID=2945102 RepID=A0A9X2IH29_9ACTN|nr:hypothetical protein [Nocardioides bruguierae]MCM0622179.1 hypothetical protein [Nocardioides bruguierae]
MRPDPHLRDPLTTGRVPYLATATLLAFVALANLLGAEVSRALTREGGQPLDVAWSLCLILGWTLVFASSVMPPGMSGMILERAGLILVSVGATVYGVVLIVGVGGLDGALMLVALDAAAVISCVHRAWELHRRLRWVRHGSRP